jgi:hypothetical protein
MRQVESGAMVRRPKQCLVDVCARQGAGCGGGDRGEAVGQGSAWGRLERRSAAHGAWVVMFVSDGVHGRRLAHQAATRATIVVVGERNNDRQCKDTDADLRAGRAVQCTGDRIRMGCAGLCELNVPLLVVRGSISSRSGAWPSAANLRCREPQRPNTTAARVICRFS